MMNFNSRLKIFFNAIIVLLFLQSASVNATDEYGPVIVPLQFNETLRQHYKAFQELPQLFDGSIDTLELPFFDDFSTSHVYPDQTKWIGKAVYINNTYPVDAPTLNVATFDGLDASGNPYDPVNPRSRNLTADTLTSMPINLSGHAGQLIYLNFFYQPEGIGDAPEAYDSLVVKFKPDSFWTGEEWNTEDWIRVWRMTGRPLQEFRRALITIPQGNDTNYFHGGFQFRFMNYANRSGNLDHWHIDYVRLYEPSSPADTIFEDVAVTKPPRGMLRRYHVMPRQDFALNASSELKSNIPVNVNHLYDSVKNLSFGYELRNIHTGDILIPYSSTLTAENIGPFERIQYNRPNQFAASMVQDDNAELSLRVIINTSGDIHNRNDTAEYIQKFGPYYAYDDGSAEGGFGLMLPLNLPVGKVAQRFNVVQSDSLRAVAIHFNRSKDDVSDRRFTLKVWDEISSPGTGESDDVVLYEKEDLVPEYTDSLNGFHVFMLDEPVYVSNTFYVGWRQDADYVINIGYDKNYPELTGDTNANPNIFYNINATWNQNDDIPGVLMIRPYLSSSEIPGLNTSAVDKANKLTYNIYPNPAESYISIDAYPDSQYPVDVHIYDLHGRLMRTETTKSRDRVDISYLKSGVYVLQINSGDQFLPVTKRLIVK